MKKCKKVYTQRNIHFNRHTLTSRLISYGFVECASLAYFIQYTCEYPPKLGDLIYISEKLKECLKTHDNGSAWFDDLRALQCEIENTYLTQPAA